MSRLFIFALTLGFLLGPAAPGSGAESQMTWAAHVLLAPVWHDPAETPGLLTPFMVLYALHDGLVKPMPGTAQDVKFSFERYRGTGGKLLNDEVIVFNWMPSNVSSGPSRVAVEKFDRDCGPWPITSEQ